jgi:hypothetical protein
VDAPATTASNIACNAGDDVWCTISRVVIGRGHTGPLHRDQALPKSMPAASLGLCVLP